MKNKQFKFGFLGVLLLSISCWGQNKPWTLRECVDYALKNNISIKQSELDLQSSQLSKKDALGPISMLTHPTLGISVWTKTLQQVCWKTKQHNIHQRVEFQCNYLQRPSKCESVTSFQFDHSFFPISIGENERRYWIKCSQCLFANSIQ